MTVLDRDDAVRKAGSVGAPIGFYEMRILDEDGQEVPGGEIGEICGRGPLMMAGYYKRPDLTAKAIVDGWLHSGDLGYVDEDGYLFLVDRKKDMIISGGFNVYPSDLEAVARGHADVADVAVVGVPSERWGETPVAFVVLKSGSGMGAEEVREWVNARVNKIQRLAAVELIGQLPRSAIGKVLKRELRDGYRSKAGASI